MTQVTPRNLEKLNNAVAKVYKKQATGRLLCSTAQVRVTLHFYRGRLLWLVDDRDHRVRRWLRVTKNHLTSNARLQIPQTFGKKELWENTKLSQQILEGHLEARQARVILQQTVIETLFAIGDHESMNYRWQPVPEAEGDGSFSLPYTAFDEAVQNTLQLQQDWTMLEVSRYRAYDGLVLDGEKLDQAPGNNSAMLSLQTLLTGDRNFWDFLDHFPESPAVALRILQHFLRQEIMTFRAIGDRRVAAPAPTIPPQPRRPTILCVDDSPQSTRMLLQHFKNQRVNAVVCNDPLKAVPMAVEYQPDLILMDLVMPIVNGYEVCAQLRRVDALTEIPIVIVTDRAGLGDRVRSKLVGASGFMTKPITGPKIKGLVEQYFPGHQATFSAEPPGAASTGPLVAHHV